MSDRSITSLLFIAIHVYFVQTSGFAYVQISCRFSILYYVTRKNCCIVTIPLILPYASRETRFTHIIYYEF